MDLVKFLPQIMHVLMGWIIYDIYKASEKLTLMFLCVHENKKPSFWGFKDRASSFKDACYVEAK